MGGDFCIINLIRKIGNIIMKLFYVKNIVQDWFKCKKKKVVVFWGDVTLFLWLSYMQVKLIWI